jgi:hypothetical protein
LKGLEKKVEIPTGKYDYSNSDKILDGFTMKVLFLNEVVSLHFFFVRPSLHLAVLRSLVRLITYTCSSQCSGPTRTPSLAYGMHRGSCRMLLFISIESMLSHFVLRTFYSFFIYPFSCFSGTRTPHSAELSIHNLEVVQTDEKWQRHV